MMTLAAFFLTARRTYPDFLKATPGELAPVSSSQFCITSAQLSLQSFLGICQVIGRQRGPITALLLSLVTIPPGHSLARWP
jgi:hypothetical protein